MRATGALIWRCLPDLAAERERRYLTRPPRANFAYCVLTSKWGIQSPSLPLHGHGLHAARISEHPHEAAFHTTARGAFVLRARWSDVDKIDDAQRDAEVRRVVTQLLAREWRDPLAALARTDQQRAAVPRGPATTLERLLAEGDERRPGLAYREGSQAVHSPFARSVAHRLSGSMTVAPAAKRFFETSPRIAPLFEQMIAGGSTANSLYALLTPKSLPYRPNSL